MFQRQSYNKTPVEQKSFRAAGTFADVKKFKGNRQILMNEMWSASEPFPLANQDSCLMELLMFF